MDDTNIGDWVALGHAVFGSGCHSPGEYSDIVFQWSKNGLAFGEDLWEAFLRLERKVL